MSDPPSSTCILHTLPLLPLPHPLLLLPSAVLRIPISSRRDIQSLLAKLAYDVLSSESSSTPQPQSESQLTNPITPPSALTIDTVDISTIPKDSNFTIGFLPLDPYNSPSAKSTSPENTSNLSYRPLDPASASLDDLSTIGTIGRVIGFEQPKPGGEDGDASGAAILVEGKERFRVRNILQKTPFVEGEVETLMDHVPDPNDVELSSLHSNLQQLATTLLHLLRIPLPTPRDPDAPTHLPAPLARRLQNFIASSPAHLSGRLADFLIAAIDPPLQDRLLLLQDLDVKARLRRAIGILEKRVGELKGVLGGRIVVRNAVHQPPLSPADIVIQRRLPPARGGIGGHGGDEEQDAEIAALEKKLKAARIPPHAQQTVERELSRLKRMQSVQPEYGIQRTYLETLAEIPWVVETEDRLDGEAMKRAREVLDKDHFGLEKVKRRVLEYLAVLRLRTVLAQEQAAAVQVEGKVEVAKEAPSNGPVTAVGSIDPTITMVNPLPSSRPTTAPVLQQPPTPPKPIIMRAPILLLVGPPGTGKTSLAKSIATALGRKFHRISLGGVHSEAEIRGHRRTYIAAMPGVVVNGLRRVGVANPVLLLDEIDKIGGRSHNGDPSAALLEVLDPEQNWSFSDHYVNIPVDLSKVIFIATANDKREIPPALLDRMETIYLHAYTNLEKFHIASCFLIPKQVALNGLSTDQVQLTEQVIQTLINSYTREPGVRNLEREIGSVVRAKAVQYIDAKDSASLGSYQPQVRLEELETILGTQRYRPDLTERGNQPGVVNGLVAFSSGHGVMSGSGAIIFIEAAAMPGSGNLKLTGNLGNVIKGNPPPKPAVLLAACSYYLHASGPSFIFPRRGLQSFIRCSYPKRYLCFFRLAD
ncbi:P-loop containing nucleoside triphosphate hydrolase protein [Tirmania nivea]|nr:P-loop containing nucleoside triphosphate hydrolase protein [Tirmania nivea]